MCTSTPKAPKIPAPPPDFSDQQAALALDVERTKQNQLFAGLGSTIVTGAGGVLAPGRTTNSGLAQ